MIDRAIEKKCTGCTGCKSICPRNAIQMNNNDEGFYYPVVDYSLCVECGACIQNCHMLNKLDRRYASPDVYAAWNLDESVRISSTSGGVFTAMAEAFIAHGGYVVGACYDGDFEIKHVVINQQNDIEKLRQSKYAQSDMGDVFSEVRELLNNGNKVLFCGTPCQTAGLQKYLGKTHSNLYCCDFICRGVISPKVYRKFLNDTIRSKSTRIKEVHFKNKDFGWNRFSTKLTFSDGSVYQKDRNEDYYMRGYLKYNLYLMPVCYECQYKEIPRKSDISLGDFWGIGRAKAELDNDQGTSVVMVNSPKGESLMQWMKEKLYIEKRTLDEVLEGNSCLLNSPPVGEFREYFFKHMDHCRFDKLIDRIEEMSWHLTPKDKVLRELHLIKLKLKGLFQ